MPDIMSNEASPSLPITAFHGEDDCWPIERMLFNIINEYIQPNSDFSLEEAVNCLDQLLPENRPADLVEENEPVEDFIHLFFDLVWEIATQIPFWHSGQDKLMRLVAVLPHAKTTQTVLNSSGEEVPAWSEFAHWDIRSEFIRALEPPDKTRRPSKQVCSQYVNASAFAARFFSTALQPSLYVHSPTRRLGLNLAMRCIEAALRGTEREHLPCHWTAAAQWIVVGADWLFREIHWTEHRLMDYSLPLLARRNFNQPLGPSGWHRYYTNFRQASSRIPYKSQEADEARYWCNQAVQRMKQIHDREGVDESSNIFVCWGGITGNPQQQQQLRDEAWRRRNEKYAHLFRVPTQSEESPSGKRRRV